MRLQHATWQEVEAYLQRETGIIVPIGSTEQHGPNGLVGTDAICPETIAWELGERYGVLVAPTQNLGMAQHHLAFPGTVSLRPSTLIAVLRDTVTSLSRHGFTHIFFLNGHGGNIGTMSAAFAEIYGERSLGYGPQPATELHLTTSNWFAGPRVRELAESLYGDAEGTHATASEVALSWCARPEAVKQVDMSPRIAPRGSAQCDADEFRRRFPDGRMGSDPSLASVEHGQRFLEAGVADAWEAYRAFTQAG
ncbi:MAG: creatininase family protein [Halomonas sp.]|jgi:creatinine amidohydrolase|uniref:Creatininase family protein n=1 Tax=Billgrantia tianxiuensis TaxID=2497861 RepID=A0A6I6SEC0_9GAMM|nr:MULTISPECIES: creatininase family protein [Halomonas]MCE8033207.1 creatininase family protein [Halomonas sp. MCCC 1A11057]MDX5433726.1 creatininase family protein [Halomonas sp.]QHC48958.1 creatininase family protein [Halomonas tianxiuensis]